MRKQILSLVAPLCILAAYNEAAAQHSHISVPPRSGELAADVDFPKCGVSVRFSGKPRVLTKAEIDKTSAAGMSQNFSWEMDGVLYVSGFQNEAASCVCRNIVFTDSDLAGMQDDVRKTPNSKILRTITHERLRLAWEADYLASSVGASGPLTRIRAISSFSTFNRHCIANIQISYNESLAPSREAFLRTFQVMPAASDGHATPPKPVFPKASASSRLSELQELMDKGQITKDEYDKKRKEILDGL
jgi:hypothetical protein